MHCVALHWRMICARNLVMPRSLLSRCAALALCLVLLLLNAPGAEAAFWNRGRNSPTSSNTSAQALQEVAPPAAAQQIAHVLSAHEPRLELLSPAADSLVPAGPWTLRLLVSDWPLLQSPSLGPGAHVVVQLDGEAPVRAFDASADGVVELEMPALTPGSHRLVAYAALPWGEAVSARQARLNWRLHRGLRNQVALPDEAAPQLVAIGAPSLAATRPVPINWLLLNAPLQHLRPDDEQWRLRLSLEGSSVVLDRAQPLWLSGLKPGEHFLQLDLLDASGELLGAPFNALVLELPVPSSRSGAPAFYGAELNASQLAELSDPSVSAAAESTEATPAPDLNPEPEPEQKAPSAAVPSASEPSAEPEPSDAEDPEIVIAAESSTDATPEDAAISPIPDRGDGQAEDTAAPELTDVEATPEESPS